MGNPNLLATIVRMVNLRCSVKSSTAPAAMKSTTVSCTAAAAPGAVGGEGEVGGAGGVTPANTNVAPLPIAPTTSTSSLWEAPYAAMDVPNRSASSASWGTYVLIHVVVPALYSSQDL